MEQNIKKVKEKEKQSSKQKEIKGITNKRIQSNILIAIIIMLYFLMLSLTYQNFGEGIVLKALEVLSIAYLFIGIFVMERAYKKDNGELALYSIEVLIIAAHALSIQYVVTKYDFSLPLYITVSSYVFAIYYVFKAIIIYTKQRRKYLNTFSDIHEITKKEKPSVKEAKKRNNANGIKVSEKKINANSKEKVKQNIEINNSKKGNKIKETDNIIDYKSAKNMPIKKKSQKTDNAKNIEMKTNAKKIDTEKNENAKKSDKAKSNVKNASAKKKVSSKNSGSSKTSVENTIEEDSKIQSTKKRAKSENAKTETAVNSVKKNKTAKSKVAENEAKKTTTRKKTTTKKTDSESKLEK